MESDATLQALLKRIQELREARLSTRKMAETLEREGFEPVGRGKKWSHTVVRWYLGQLDAQAKAEHPPDKAAQPSLKIEIHGPYTAADLSLWTFLVNQLGDELRAGKEYTLPLPAVYHALEVGKGSPTRLHLWEALQRLASTRIFWDGRLGQRRNSIATQLLSGRVIDDENTLVFDYTPDLVKLLRNRHQRARLHLLLESKKR